MYVARVFRSKVLPALSVIFSSTLLLAGTAAAATGDIHTFAGLGETGYSGDGGPASMACLNGPSGVSSGPSGSLYLADTANNRIRKVDASGVISTVAGNGVAGYNGESASLVLRTGKKTRTVSTISPAASLELNAPADVAADGSGNIYIADTSNNRIRKVDASGYMSTVAGTGTAGYSGDGGQAASAALNGPQAVALDGSGNVYIADTKNNRIRKINSSGVISTVAGTGTAGYSGNGGAAALAMINQPRSVAVDGIGNIYIADTNNQRIRLVNTSGIISTVTGTGTAGYTGDGGLAVYAGLNSPSDVAADPSGGFYIADGSNHRVRKVDASGIISTVAGDGVAGYSGDEGPASSAHLNNPSGLALDSGGNLYVSDSLARRVRMVEGTGYLFPTSAIGQPQTPDTIITQKYTVKGSASAANGVAYVEVSTDGGLSWNTASGTSSWSYTWTPPSDGSYYIMSRAHDSVNQVDKILSCVHVTEKLDTAPPASAITSPVAGSVPAGGSCTITGSAGDGTGSGVASVEVSTDGGASWYAASGTTSWSYSWSLPSGGGNFVIKSRAADYAGNTEAPGAGVGVTVGAVTGQASLAWDPSTTTTVTGYKVYLGTQPGVYTQSIDAGNVTSCTVANLPAGATYYFSVKSYDVSGNVSAYSAEVSKKI